jgi:uncharacterized membrane protein HdeD (DUF308 family)
LTAERFSKWIVPFQHFGAEVAMSDVSAPAPGRISEELARRIVERRQEFFWLGIAMSIIGLLAVFFPVFATLTVELMVGWLLIMVGLVTLFGSFRVEGTGAFFGTLLLALLYIGLGLYLITHPGIGVISLTLLLAALFLVEGAVQLSFAFEMRSRQGWFWILLSGLVSIAVGLLIAGGMPGTSLFALGLITGINFLSTGIAFIVLSQSVPAESMTSGRPSESRAA